MRPIWVLLAIVAVTAPASAQTKPGGAAREGQPATSSLAFCQHLATEAAGPNPSDPLVRENFEVAKWCIMHDPNPSRRWAVAVMLWGAGYGLGLEVGNTEGQSDAYTEFHPLADSKQCSDIDRMLGDRGSASIDKALDAYLKLSRDDQQTLENRAAQCALGGAEDEKSAAITLEHNIALQNGYTDGLNEGYDNGWNAGAKAQLHADKKLNDLLTKMLMDDQKVMAAEKPPGFWDSLILGLASRPRSSEGNSFPGYDVHIGDQTLHCQRDLVQVGPETSVTCGP